ncbi:MAG: hypothetical protein OCD02_10420 [Spirochaetaceae bacterium]
MKALKILYNDKGYTFIEVFITVLIVSLISTVLYTNSNQILTSLNKGTHNLKRSYDLLNLRHTLFFEAQNIMTPWFYTEHSIVQEQGFIEVFYYMGLPDYSIKISSSESGTFIYINDNIIYESKYLVGSFTITESAIKFVSEDIEFSFVLGVILA